jgi:hypothetical protein
MPQVFKQTYRIRLICELTGAWHNLNFLICFNNSDSIIWNYHAIRSTRQRRLRPCVITKQG